jgi:bacterial/archaeal transporter family-2 protein
MYQIYAVFIGLLITVMVTFNGILDSYLSSYFSLFVIHTVGLVTLIVILIVKKEKLKIKRGIPAYLFSGGAIGVVMVFLNNLCFAELGASLTLALGVLGQLVLAAFIDHFGLLHMSIYKFQKRKLIGFGIILVGIIVMTIY